MIIRLHGFLSVLSITLVGSVACIFIPACRAANEPPSCELNVLPTELQHRIETDFSSWKIQDMKSLSPRARDRWQGEKPLGCPGVAVGRFESNTQASYALLLVPKNNPDSAYKLLVFTPNPTHAANAMKIVDEWDKGGASNNFIHVIQIAKVFSQEWIGKLDVRTKDGILAVDSGENEYGVEVFFWSKGQYRREPIDY